MSKRKIVITKQLLLALFNVWKWASERRVIYFTRKDIKQFTSGNETITANFGYLTWAGGLIFHTEKGKGYYGINKHRCYEFFSGKTKVPTVLVKDPFSEDIDKLEYKFFKDVKGVEALLDQNREYIVEYIDSYPHATLF